MTIRLRERVNFASCNNLDCLEYANAHRMGATFEIKYNGDQKFYNIYFPEEIELDDETFEHYFNIDVKNMFKKWISLGLAVKIK